MSKSKIILLLVLLTIIVLFYLFKLDRYLTFAFLKQNYQILIDIYHETPIKFLICFILAYLIFVIVAFPGVLIFTLAGGAVFGPLLATLILVVTGSVGSSLSMLMSRYVIRQFIEKIFSKWLVKFNRIIERGPLFTIASIRLIPIFPFVSVNLMAGITHLKVRHFFLGTLLGMTPSTYLYASAGQELSQISGLNDIITPKLVLILLFLATFATITIFIKIRFLNTR